MLTVHIYLLATIIYVSLADFSFHMIEHATEDKKKTKGLQTIAIAIYYYTQYIVTLTDEFTVMQSRRQMYKWKKKLLATTQNGTWHAEIQ